MYTRGRWWQRGWHTHIDTRSPPSPIRSPACGLAGTRIPLVGVFPCWICQRAPSAPVALTSSRPLSPLVSAFLRPYLLPVTRKSTPLITDRRLPSPNDDDPCAASCFHSQFHPVPISQIGAACPRVDRRQFPFTPKSVPNGQLSLLKNNPYKRGGRCAIQPPSFYVVQHVHNIYIYIYIYI